MICLCQPKANKYTISYMKTSLYTDERVKAIECWQNLQFGMFIQFGLYSLAGACKKNGLAFGVYFSLIDWHCPWALPISSHNSDRIPEKHHAYNLAQLTELMTNYGDICELWLDMGHPTRQQSQEMYDLVHGLQKNIMINGRIWNDKGDFATMADNEMPELPEGRYELNVPWQTPASIYKETWGYKSWQERTDAQGEIRNLTDSLRRVVSHGGNYLLNIGPDNEGNIVPFEKEVLEGIGENLRKEPLERACPTALPPQTAAVHPAKSPQSVDTPSEMGSDTCLFRYTGEDYYSLRPIVTGKRRYVPTNGGHRSYILGWACDAPLKEDIKLCFEDDEKRLYFSLAKGKTSGIISTNYRLPEPAGAHDRSGSAGAHGGPGAQCAVLELSTVGNPLERPELPAADIRLTLNAADATAG